MQYEWTRSFSLFTFHSCFCLAPMCNECALFFWTLAGLISCACYIETLHVFWYTVMLFYNTRHGCLHPEILTTDVAIVCRDRFKMGFPQNCRPFDFALCLFSCTSFVFEVHQMIKKKRFDPLWSICSSLFLSNLLY